jgi:addiction module HigA family antidote
MRKAKKPAAAQVRSEYKRSDFGPLVRGKYIHRLRASSNVVVKNPVHPGRIVRHDCLEPLGLSVTAGAKILGVTRQTLTKIVNGKSGISPEMAIRLTKAFGSTEETWLRMQLACDLAAARKDESKIKVRRQFVPQELHVQ